MSGTGAGRRAVPLLAAQAFTLGTTTAWVLIPSTTIFLDRYGAGLLPWTYVGAAAAGGATTVALGAAQRRHPLVEVAGSVLRCALAFVLVAWTMLVTTSAGYVSYGLLVVVPLLIPVGFMFVVGQAGAILDVRALKAGYGRVIAGFALGFTAAGLLAPPLLARLGRVEDILAFAAGSLFVWLVLLRRTHRSFAIALDVVEQHDDAASRPSLLELARDRYVLLIIAFQGLSAIESQCLDFLVFDRAAARYEGDALATFISRFTVIAYGADIVFLLLIAGFLLRRLGLRYGLTANSLGVLGLVLALTAATAAGGSASALVFVLAVAARVTDLVMSDGATRNSLSAAYQVVPAARRLAAQSTAEGLAVPVAIGIAGGLLLLLGAHGATDTVALPLVIAGVVAAWSLVAAALYRGYRSGLLDRLRQRELDPGELTMEEADVDALDRLLASPVERDVRLGLEALAAAGHSILTDRLVALARDDRPTIRAVALQRLVEVEPDRAVEVARRAIDDGDPSVRAVAVRALGRIGDDAIDARRIAAAAAAGDPLVRVAAAEAGGPALRGLVVGDAIALATSSREGDRVVAAGLLACNGARDPSEGTAVVALLQDPEPGVRAAMLESIRIPETERVVTAVVAAAGDRRAAGLAFAALTRLGSRALPPIVAALADPTTSDLALLRLVRACREIGSGAAEDVLRCNVHHPRREVALAALEALAAPDPPVDSRPDLLVAEVLETECGHAAEILHALVVLEEDAGSEVLVRALRDQLDLVRRRVLAVLAIRHGSRPIASVSNQLAQSDARCSAMALEWLDVSLDGSERVALPLLEPGVADAERSRRLYRALGREPASLVDPLVAVVGDGSSPWRHDWVVACAVHAAASADPPRHDVFELVMTSAATSGEDVLRETLLAMSRRLAGV